jgi:ATP-dependent DNA helicase RecQ
VIKDGSRWYRTPIDFKIDQTRIQRITERRVQEWSEVKRYISHDGCLMEFLARALDDAAPRTCGRCAHCVGAPLVSPDFSTVSVTAAARFLRQSELPLECKVQVAQGAFPRYGFRGNLPLPLRAETGRILSRWNDAGWGRVVAEDKHNGCFRDELVAAVAEMVRERWQPSPPPSWVTCVPSKNHPDLVPDFAKRLAAVLRLPFRQSVAKVQRNDPQKMQQNRFHQCQNLDGVFAIEGDLSAEPVLLVDDVVDSGWTLTVVAALLRRAGSGAVWPLALTTSNVGG